MPIALNEPAATSGNRSSRWLSSPDWYLWDGGFFALGHAEGTVPPHSHHAIQITLAIEGTLGIQGADGHWRRGMGIVIKPDVVHSYEANGALGAMVFVDPESVEGVWLRSSLRREITVVPESRLLGSTRALRQYHEEPLEGPDIGQLIRQCVHTLCAGAPPSRRLDERITRVLARIAEADDLRLSVEDAAAMAFLSPSRFSHLFRQQVGLSFKRYMLWRKLVRAVLAIGGQNTITEAAHAANFADAAHLTRTFYQMFGLPPSVMLRGEFFQIASPFAAPAGSEAGE